MKKSELKQIIREEIQKVLKEESTNDQNVIKSYLNDLKEGIYVFIGGLRSDDSWNMTSLKKAKPLYYTSSTVVNRSKLIGDLEKKYPNIEEFTIVDIDRDGNIDVSTT